MKRTNRLLALVLIVLIAVLVYRNNKKLDNPIKTEPAKVETIEGSDLKRVILTTKAAERLGIETAPVRLTNLTQSALRRLVVPYASIIYDLNGETWVYTSPEPLAFVRHPIIVDYIEGETVYLISGPDVGTDVVIVGVAEIYGVETGVGK